MRVQPHPRRANREADTANGSAVAEVRSPPADLTRPAMSMKGFTAWFPIVLDAAIPAILRTGEDQAPR